jgi:uncharacterized protein
MSGSALYEGTVTHRRHGPVKHGLSYRVLMPLLDLDDLPGALDAHPLWSARRPAPVRFRARDFLADAGAKAPRTPAELAATARGLVGEGEGPAPTGPVRLLANPRTLGIGFNPVSFLFLYDEPGERVEAVIAEVTNTPWGERHAYVARRESPRGPIRAGFRKRLHVSPFNPMDQDYELEIGEPGASLGISIRNRARGEVVFEATLALRRRELTRPEMTRVMIRYPPSALATLARIYWHGLRLKLKGAPHHPHPGARARTG